MKGNIKKKAREILDSYLELRSHRKTPERYAILDAVYSMDGHFSLEELDARLGKDNFRVSRATLYNTMRLFLELRLVIRRSCAMPVPSSLTEISTFPLSAVSRQ